MKKKKIISILIPVYNEEDNIIACYESVKNVFQNIKNYDFEIVFTDNHSQDKTEFLISKLALQDKRVKFLRFSRNFGFQLSILTGYKYCEGAAALQLDCDLQDPPELIPAFIEMWEKGYNVVYGVRKSRKEGIIITAIRKLFYRILAFISENEIPLDAGDFRLVDRCVIKELIKVQDPDIYIRGFISTIGFNQIGIEYRRKGRLRGKSKFNFGKNMRLAMDAITSNSALPLRISSYFGFLLTGLSMLMIMFYVITYFLGDQSWPKGFITLLVFQIFSLGIMSLFLGIMGEYIARIYAHQKKISEPIIEKTNLKKNSH